MRRTNLKVLLISGKQGSGKDTLAEGVAQFLRVVGSANVQNFRFAEDIYNIHDYARQRLRALGIEVPEDKDGDLLQYLGTEWGRKKFGNNVWTKTTGRRIRNWANLTGGPQVAIVTDCRFINEFDAFPNAYRVRLTCPEKIRKKRRGKTWRKNVKHASEIDLDGHEKAGKFDLVLDTNENGPDACAQIVFDLLSQ